MDRRIGLALAAAALLGLSACERRSEAARNHAEEGGAGAASSAPMRAEGSGGASSSYVAARGEGGGSGSYGDGGYRKREPIPDFHGEPMWSDNRKHTATENAHYHCDKSGADIGAKSFDDCLTKVHDFLDHPPAGAKTIKRANGDKLVYDPKANMFAVARKDGAPRTFFKPREGEAYWQKQVAEADDPRGYRSSRRYGSGDRAEAGGGE